MSKEQALQGIGEKPDFRERSSLMCPARVLLLSFSSILTNCKKASTGGVSKQDLDLLLGWDFFFFFSLLVLSFREFLDVRNHHETSPCLLKR